MNFLLIIAVLLIVWSLFLAIKGTLKTLTNILFILGGLAAAIWFAYQTGFLDQFLN